MNPADVTPSESGHSAAQVLDDLYVRLAEKTPVLIGLIARQRSDAEVWRLKGKVEGVALAMGFVREAREELHA